VIRFDGVTITYAGSASPVLRDMDLRIDEGELCLVIGPTGGGKSTLLGAMNGLVPHFTGGTLLGTVSVDGRDTRTHPPRELADVVGYVGQDPLSGFVTDVVEEELAYAMEHLALDPPVMRKRVEEILDLLGLADLRDRPLRTLSGGQQQRVAIGAALTAHPRVLVLDEPTSALDPTAAEEVIAAVTRLVHDLGMTVVLAEHRLERVIQHADRVVWVPGDGGIVEGPPADVLASVGDVPPIVGLARLAGWSPLPLSIRDARRLAPGLRLRLAEQTPDERPSSGPSRDAGHTPGDASIPALIARGITVTYGSLVAVRDVELTLPAGGIAAVMGRNGSGKSSLLWALQGSALRRRGTVWVDGRDPADLDPPEARRLVGLVPQEAGDLLYLATVGAECHQADIESDATPGTCRGLLDRLVPGVPDEAHPRDLSEGQRLAVVLAIQLAARPHVVLLDEPTRGLDYAAKRHLATILRDLAGEGRAILLSTHDVEFVATVADRVLVMADGEIVADGSADDVLVASPAFAPQVARILAPLRWLTVDDVARALGA
jgi:ATPase components of various ABC-type transport systems, contain duplicated ATPase